jgi:hypothetical protein
VKKKARRAASESEVRLISGVTDTITISDSSESSDEELVKPVQVGGGGVSRTGRVSYALGQTRSLKREQHAEADEEADADCCVEDAAGGCGGDDLPMEEELEALRLLEEEIARQSQS